MEKIDYFFINKTSSSDHLSRSDAEEKRSIGAYIQGRRVRIQQTQSHRLATDNASRTSSNDGSRAVEISLQQDQTSHILENAPSSPQLHACNAVPFISLETTNASRCRIESIWILQAPNTAPTPFQFTNVTVDTNVYDLLYYFVRSYEPSTRHIEITVLSKHNSACEQQPSIMCLYDILCNQMETDALLAAMAARIQDVEYVDQGRRDLVYSNQAMSAISKSVSGTIDYAPRVFRAIFFLAIAAWHNQDTQVLQVHLKGLKAILDSGGGIEAANMAIRKALLRLDGMASAVQFERPCFASKQFEICDEDQTWLINKVLNLGMLSVLGQQLVDGEYRPIYGLGLHSLISSLVQYVRVIELQSELTCPCPRLVNLVSCKLDLIRHQLLELQVAGIQQRIIRVAILIWMMMVLTSEGLSRSVQLMVVGLRDLLSERHRDQWNGHEPLYFWILSVGIMAAEAGSPTYMYLISEIKMTLMDANVTHFESKEGLVQFLRKFLYLSCAQAQLMPKLAWHVVV